jgi:hypothetical protein
MALYGFKNNSKRLPINMPSLIEVLYFYALYLGISQMFMIFAIEERK